MCLCLNYNDQITSNNGPKTNATTSRSTRYNTPLFLVASVKSDPMKSAILSQCNTVHRPINLINEIRIDPIF